MTLDKIKIKNKPNILEASVVIAKKSSCRTVQNLFRDSEALEATITKKKQKLYIPKAMVLVS